MITSAAPTLCPSLPYAGEVTPREAWEMLSQAPAARLVDVRTPAEWMFVGGPSLSSLGKRAILIPWKLYPNFENNPRFLEQLQNEAPDKAAPLLFLCRSGGRSLDAACAAATAGYTHCYNITDGFEGPQDPEGHRGVHGGWKASHLPWEQG